MRVARVVSLVLLTIVACAATLAGCRREPPPSAAPAFRPSVLLVTLDTTRADALDTTRADALGVGGAPAWATPNLDALAARGIRFATARAPAPVTMPAHATIMTGTYPFQHGVRDNGTFILGDGARTLAERLKGEGYATAAVPAAFVLDSSFGLAQGFDHYYDLEQHDMAIGDNGEERTADEVVAKGLEFLATIPPGPAGGRFFLWLHFYDPHFPYAPPADLVAAHPFDPGDLKPGKARVAEQHHLYQLEVANVDRALGRLLKELDRFGGAPEVLTLVVGDHGEGLGQHAEATHAALAYDATLHVPFLLAHQSLPQGRVVAPAVSTVDVAPTLLALLGLASEGTYGADLGPLLRGEPFAPQRALYFENCATWFTSGWAPLYGIVDPTGRWKTIAGPQVRLFDVVADGGETKDLAAEQPEIVAQAQEQLHEFADATIAAARHEPDAAELEHLHAIGYVVTQASTRRDSLVPPGWQPKGALTPEQGLENTRRFTQANQLWKGGKREEGVRVLLDLVKDEPQNAHYAEIASALLVEMGRPAEALPLVRTAIELAENFANRSTLVACLVALGRKDDAFAEAAVSVERYPRLLPARLTLGQFLVERGKPAEAVPHLELFVRDYKGSDATRAQAQALLERARAAAGGK